ncbi:hypothetical protein HLI01_23990 [Rhizobium laguerreae]|nr:hypothetical protein [Rhizobium laguerreae]
MAFGDLSGHPPPDCDAVSAGIIFIPSLRPGVVGLPLMTIPRSLIATDSGANTTQAAAFNFDLREILSMAKGQVRSNREVRKPKKDKQAAKVESTFANQMKTATKTAPQGSAPKK